jgi:hypothetical protein
MKLSICLDISTVFKVIANPTSRLVLFRPFLQKSLDKVDKILKGSLDSIPSPTSSVKIQIMGRESLLEV